MIFTAELNQAPHYTERQKKGERAEISPINPLSLSSTAISTFEQAFGANLYLKILPIIPFFSFFFFESFLLSFFESLLFASGVTVSFTLAPSVAPLGDCPGAAVGAASGWFVATAPFVLARIARVPG